MRFRRQPVSLAALALALAVTSLPTPIAASPAVAVSPKATAALPAPAAFSVQEQDDRSAILQWDASESAGNSNPPGVVGYYIQWQPITATTVYTGLTTDRVFQVQPLVNGDVYSATVQAVDTYGNLGPASGPITFTGNSARVDAQRAQDTAFFDSFNRPEGVPDQTKWNIATSRCAVSPDMTTGSLINSQFHMHDMIGDGPCDREMQTDRPRAQMTLPVGVTRTISWDMDGTFDREQWYLDLVPCPLPYDNSAGTCRHDLSNLVDLEGQGGNYSMAPAVRFKQNSETFDVLTFDGAGNESSSWASDIYQQAWSGNALVNNVRRHFVIHVRQINSTTMHADMSVNGLQVFSTDSIPNTATVVQPLWDILSYNPQKDNMRATLLHWDNFGFDGAAPTIVTHNYKNTLYDGGMDWQTELASQNDSPMAWTIPMNDSTAGASAAYVMLSEQMNDNNLYEPSASDTIYVNGHPHHLAPVVGAPGTTTVSTISGVSVVVPIPLSELISGNNVITVTTAGQLGIGQVHIEVDFPASGPIPPYTEQPLQMNPMMMLPHIGPSDTVNSINGQALFSQGSLAQNQQVFSVSGKITLNLTASDWQARFATGHVPGIARATVDLDGQRVFDQRVDAQVPAPAVSIPWTFDTTTLTNGIHVITPTFYDEQGYASQPDYFLGDSPTISSWPITISVQTAASAATNTASATATNAAIATATNTPAPTSTPTHASAASATAQPTSTGTLPSATPAACGGGVVGHNSIGTIADGSDGNNINALQFTTGPTGGTLASASVYVQAVDSAPNNQYQIAVYTDNNNAPGSLVAKSAMGTLTANSWNTIPLTATLAGATKYWLAYNTNALSASGNSMPYDSNGVGAWSSASVPFGSFPSTAPSMTGGADNFSIYATFAGCGGSATATATTPASTNTPISTQTSTATAAPSSSATSTNTASATATNTPVPTSTSLPLLSVKIPSVSVSNATVAPGGAETLSATVLSTNLLANALIDFEVYCQSGTIWNKVYQTTQSGVSLAASGPRTFSTGWSVPSSQSASACVLQAGVFSADWLTSYVYNSSGASFSVVAGASSPTKTPLPPTNTATATPTKTATATPTSTVKATATPYVRRSPIKWLPVATSTATAIRSALPSHVAVSTAPNHNNASRNQSHSRLTASSQRRPQSRHTRSASKTAGHGRPHSTTNSK